MTRYACTALKALLLITCSALYSGVASAVPAIWEAQLGATVTNSVGVPALDTKNDDDTNNSLTFGSMSFPFAGITYTGGAVLNISSNGFISLGGDNGSGCIVAACGGNAASLTDILSAARIAPFWTDLDPGGKGGDVFINRFNDDADAAIDRIVITFATGHADCPTIECSVLVQVQLLENGTIIFGYNGIDLANPPGDTNDAVLVGISPADGTDPGESDLSALVLPVLPYDSGIENTVYELFEAAPSPVFDLDDTNLVFTPKPGGGFLVNDTMTTPPASTQPPMWETRIGTTLGGTSLDDQDDTSVNYTFGPMSFPFAGTTYTGTTSPTGTHILNISSNGFISLGGDNGNGCDALGDCEGDVINLVSSLFPRIAPFWTDLSPVAGGDIFFKYFDEVIDRLVITFATGHFECVADACHVLVQLQLFEDGKIVFGYNGIDLTNTLDDLESDVIVGISAGAGNSTSTNFSNTAPFNSGTVNTIYELFVAASTPPVDLDNGNLVFTPNPVGGGFAVTAPGVSGAAIAAATAGKNTNQGHCSLAGPDAALDPTLWLLVLVSVIYLRLRRPRSE